MQNFDLLIDPISQSKLELYTIDTLLLKNNNEIVKTGFLYSTVSKTIFPIINGVPILLTFTTILTQNFTKEHAEIFSNSQFKSYKLANLEPMIGERSIQETFTEEWADLGNNEITFAYDEEQGIALHKDVWLRMNENEYKTKKLVLDVGCGFGKEAQYLSDIFPNSQVVAVDLNLAVIAAGITLLETNRIFPIVASLFKLPFKDALFDHVHSQGVIHHTYSTKDAFFSIEKKVNNTGSIFIWVYAWEDSFGIKGVRGVLIHLYWFLGNRIFRPLLSRSPVFIRNAMVHIISFLYHPLIKNRGINKDRNWSYSNTLHGVRDMFTPMFAHRLRFNEVLIWFETKNYQVQVQSPLTYEKLFAHRLLGIGYLGRK